MTDASQSAPRLYHVIAQVLDVPPETLDDRTSPDTLASWDSLRHLNLVMAIESEFEVSLSPEDALDMRNVGLIRAILRERGVPV